jgi:hypothetical protein
MDDSAELYGLLAEFDDPHTLVEAVEKTRAAGYRNIDAYTPIPVHGLVEALGDVPTKLPWLTFIGGVLGAITGVVLQYYVSVIDYPMNVGGRPVFSWPSYIPVTFECTVLGAALFSVLGMLALNGLPLPYHPVFNVPEFRLASRNRFFLCIEARDPAFQLQPTREFLAGVKSLNVHEVAK